MTFFGRQASGTCAVWRDHDQQLVLDGADQPVLPRDVLVKLIPAMTFANRASHMHTVYTYIIHIFLQSGTLKLSLRPKHANSSLYI